MYDMNVAPRANSIALDRVIMRVASRSSVGEVNSETQLRFEQKGSLVSATYAGGTIRLGYLIGTLRGKELSCRYVQINWSGRIDGGSSHCEFAILGDGRLTMREHFCWHTRNGSGVNVFEEVPPAR
jgi:hypothetical protein